jgi:hypothetical protein
MIRWATHRKFVAAVIGIGVMLLNRKFGVDLYGFEPLVVDLIVGVATLLAVERLPNDPVDTPEGEA